MPAPTDTFDFSIFRRRYRAQKTLRGRIEPTWDEIKKFMGPVTDSNSSGTSQGTGVAEKDKDVWDFTAIDGREKLASSMHMSITNPNMRWFLNSFRKSALNRDTEAKSWLDQESEDVWNDLQDSDFNVEIGSNYHDLTGPGCTFLAIEPIPGEIDPKTLETKWEGVDFTAIPLEEAYFEPDRKGDVRTFWRRHSWTASEVVDHCEKREIPVPEKVAAALEKGDATLFEVVFCVFPRPKIQKRKKVRYPAPEKLRPWGSQWWLEDTGELLGAEGGYYEKPILRGRWSSTSGSKWSHGPGNIALPTVRYLNAWMESYKTAGEKAVDPPILANEKDLIANVDLTPGGLTPCRDINGFKTLESAGRFDVAETIIANLQAQVKTLFRTDDLQLKDSPAMTATEAQIRYELMNRVLGRTLTFIQNDLLGPVILTIMAMRIRLGVAAPMPKQVKDAGGVFNIEYQGPLARSQRTDEVAAIERGAAFVAGLAQFYPKVRAAFDPIIAIKHVFNRLGIPADVIPSEEQMRKAVAQAEAEEKRAIAADAAQKEAKAMKDTATTPGASGGNGAVAAGAVYPPLPPTPPLSPATGQPAGVM
jgi:hypothetical protein